MALKKVKKRKKRFGKRAFAGSSRSGQGASLRPGHVEKLPPCRHACPSGNRIREFLTTIARASRLEKSTEQAFEQAWEIYTETSPFPAVCGRVCPHPCEDECNRKELDEPLNVNEIERAIGDFGLQKKLKLKTLADRRHPEKIAVVGAGPGGLSCAYQLARRGYEVTVFEPAEKPGGMLLWGIPRSRLPADVLEGEIQKILDLGVELKCNTRVGQHVSLEDLHARYQAVLVGIDAEKGLEGVDADDDAGNGADGLAVVTTAIGKGRRAAESIELKLRGEQEPENNEPPLVRTDRMRPDHYEKKERVRGATLPVEERPAAVDAEIKLPMPPEQVVEESGRCLSCGFCFDCEKCWLFCQDQAIEKPLDNSVPYSFKLQNCTGCGKCARECPCGFIDML